MRLATVKIEQSAGGVLLHNIADAQGHKALSKGYRLTADDVEKLRALGKTNVLVGMFEDGDVGENDAATRIANAVAGKNVTLTPVRGGRINLLASTRGVLEVNDDALHEINLLDGITVATAPAHHVVDVKKMVATIKTIGLAIAESVLQQVERIARETPNVIAVRELRAGRAAVILTGSDEARERVEKTFTAPIHSRIQELGSRVVWNDYVEHDAHAIADALERAKTQNVDCVILAGETSIMDVNDVTPSGIVQAGGKIELYGAPVEPGNLLLLAYAGDLPILGAPGCVKSRETNVVDLILPRLLAGERVQKRDIVELANGGLLI
ncbi:MAG: molybdopterin-binding protein [Chloroflexi bacterium]|nr:molybdopterin-binding protein [Chloroflexota bacterium]